MSVEPPTPSESDTKLSSTRAFTVEQSTPIAMEPSGPTGIGGWLILPIISLVAGCGFTCFYLAITPWQGIRNILFGNIPRFAGLQFPIILELLSAFFIIGWSIFALVMLFKRSPRTPQIMTVFYIAAIVSALIELFLEYKMKEVLGSYQDEATRMLIRSIVGAAIWIPYFHSSKRVANTFKSQETKINEQLDRVFS